MLLKRYILLKASRSYGHTENANPHILGRNCVKTQGNTPPQQSKRSLRVLFSKIAADLTCHGTDPRRKYISTYPNDSMSSLRDCSIPRCVLMDAYRAVPVKFLFSLYGMWMWVLGSRYFFASPKSMMLTWFARLPKPIRKLSGLISRWMKLFVWTYSIRDICKHSKPVNTVHRCF